jgi:predicted amidophosphoribosyltransferase
VLTHVRRVQDQAGLDAAGRAANLRGALAVRPARVPSVRGRAVLLVDDVMTTGATLASGAAAIRAAGAHPFGVAVVAATVRVFGGDLRSSAAPPDADAP